DAMMMDLERLQNLQADRRSACQSLGSNRQLFSQSWKQLGGQSRKMSIGIVLDSLRNPTRGHKENDKALRPSGEKEIPASKNQMERKNEKQEVQSMGNGSRFEAERQEGSPWITPRPRWSPVIPEKVSNPVDVGTSEREARSSVQNGANRAIPESGDGKQKKVDGLSCIKGNENFKFATKRIPYAAAAEKVYLAEEGVLQGRTNVPENRSKKTLIMNLWKTLGTPASPNKQHVDSQKIEAGAGDIKGEQNKSDKLDKFDKPSKTKQCSDTIEPDSESPVQGTKRVATRCSAKKRASNELCPQKTAKKQATPGLVDAKKVTRNQAPACKARQPKNTITFDEKWFSINPNAAAASSISKRNSIKKSCQTKVTDTSPPAEEMGDRLSEHISKKRSSTESKKGVPVIRKQTMDSPCSSKSKDKMEDLGSPTLHGSAESQNQFCGQSPLRNDLQGPDAKSSLLEEPAAYNPFGSSAPRVNLMEDQYKQPAGVKTDCFHHDAFTLGSKRSGHSTAFVKEMQQKSSCYSSKMKPRSGNTHDPTSADNAEKQSQSRGRFQQSVADGPNDVRSPGTQKETDARSPSCHSLLQANEVENHCKVPSHAEAEFSSSKSRKGLTRCPDTSGSDTVEPSDKSSETKDSPDSDPEMLTGEKNNDCGQSTVKRRKLDSIVEDVLANKGAGFTEDMDAFPEICLMRRPICPRNKRFHFDQENNNSEFSPVFGSPKETGDMMEALQQTQEESLSRAVTLFGLALEKVRSKMVSAMKKRCSDILASSTEEIHQQLQLLESRIQNDIGKLTTQSKSKRKCLETRFQGCHCFMLVSTLHMFANLARVSDPISSDLELQDQLKVIHEKFRGEIDCHLQDCRNFMEEREAEEIELGGVIERQKASHRKLVLQVEEAVQNNLVEVERRITMAHEASSIALYAKEMPPSLGCP
ncbi:Meiosis-specific protein ASY3-like protein, partial [Drosera capensis]